MSAGVSVTPRSGADLARASLGREVVLIPVKGFRQAKRRLGGSMSDAMRIDLVRSMAEHVVAASAPLPVAVVCDDPEVAEWARRLGATVMWEPGQGLNGAVGAGVDQLARAGVEWVIVAHGDLPRARGLGALLPFGGITLIPDRYDDGTNVMRLPAGCQFIFAYGPGSFRRHRAEAARLGLPTRVLRIPALAYDVDWPADVTEFDVVTGRAWSARANPVNDLPSGGAMSSDLAVPGIALAVGAHPDDIEFGCGGTLAKWAAAGTSIHHLVLTDGAKGMWDPDGDGAALVARRQDEQRRAAAILGGGDVEFLGWPDGELANSTRAQWEVSRSIRTLRPDVVLGHDPWRRYRLHPDHRHAGFIVTDAMVAARDPHFFPDQGLTPHRPQALLLWEADQPNHVEDVADFVPTKIAALLAHQSQHESTMGMEPGRPADEAAFTDRVRQQLSEHGGLAGLPQGESFHLITET